MEALLTLLKDTITNQALLQVFVGGCTMLLIGWMVTRAKNDRDALPAPAPQTLTDVPLPFAQGPRETIDLMRESRDFLRRLAEDSGAVRECVRIIREESKRQTEILDRIEREQALENRAHDRGHRA